MADKCVNTGDWIEMCDFLKKQVVGRVANFEDVVYSNRSSKKPVSRLMIVAGNTRAGKVGFNFCPFCGVDIETEYKESK